MGEPCVLLVGDRDEDLVVAARHTDHHAAREALRRRAPGALVRQRDGAVLEVRPGTRAHLALVERWVATHRSAVRGSDEAREVERVVVPVPPPLAAYLPARRAPLVPAVAVASPVELSAPPPSEVHAVGGPVVPAPTDGLAAILTACAGHFGVTKRALLGRSKVAHVVLARHLSMFLLRERLGLSYPALGVALGGLDHTSAMHAVRRISEASRSGDPVVCRALREIPARLSGALGDNPQPQPTME